MFYRESTKIQHVIAWYHIIPSSGKPSTKGWNYLCHPTASEFFLHKAAPYSEFKGTVMSRAAFLFKQSSSTVTEADTMKGIILRHFWVPWENEPGTVQASRRSSPLVFSVCVCGRCVCGVEWRARTWSEWFTGEVGAVQPSDCWVCVPLGMRAGKG